jgi:hypothetical protein
VTIEVGDILKSKITEDLYWVKKIGDSVVVLEDKSGLARVSIRKETIGLYFEKMIGGDAQWHLLRETYSGIN